MQISRLALVLTLIAAGAAFALSLVESLTREPIAEQRRQATLRALAAVLPPADNSPDADTVTLFVGEDRRGREILRTFYRGRQEGEINGIAFRVTAPDGYSGNIDVMVGVRPDGVVHGIEILFHMETPGLGDKIEENWFKEQFRNRDLANTDWRVKKDGGDFDQITGATISPRVIVTAVRGGLEFYARHRGEILQPPAPVLEPEQEPSPAPETKPEPEAEPAEPEAEVEVEPEAEVEVEPEAEVEVEPEAEVEAEEESAEPQREADSQEE
jgi:Na+-translocating ferredoxin:NAD+ oxidoreductase subunit G